MWVLLDGAFTPGFDEFGALAPALLWLVGVTAVAAVAAAQFHRLASPQRGMTAMTAFGLRPTSAKAIHDILSLSRN